jgi:hypothetical protein
MMYNDDGVTSHPQDKSSAWGLVIAFERDESADPFLAGRFGFGGSRWHWRTEYTVSKSDIRKKERRRLE